MMNESKIINFVRDIYQTNGFIPLHEPSFIGKEQTYIKKAIESTLFQVLENMLINLKKI